MEIVVHLLYQLESNGSLTPIADNGRQYVADSGHAVGMTVQVGETNYTASTTSTWTLYDNEVDWQPGTVEHNGHQIRLGLVNFVISV